MKNTQTRIVRIAAATGITLGAFALSVVAATWTAPTSAPPNGNVDAPINVGYGLQTKYGYLDIVGQVSAGVANTYGLIVENGNVGIGTLTPTTKLEVVGTASMTGLVVSGGSPASGQVLTSDANGVATWQTPVAGGSAVTSISGVAYVPLAPCNTTVCSKVVSISSGNFTSPPAITITPKWTRFTGDEDIAWWVTNVTTTSFKINWHTPSSGTNYGEPGVIWTAQTQTVASESAPATVPPPNTDVCGGGHGTYCP